MSDYIRRSIVITTRGDRRVWGRPPARASAEEFTEILEGSHGYGQEVGSRPIMKRLGVPQSVAANGQARLTAHGG